MSTYIPQYMVASFIPEESDLGRGMKRVREAMDKQKVQYLQPKPKDHISYLPPWRPESFEIAHFFALGLAKGLRFLKAADSESSPAVLKVTGCDFFGDNDRAIAVEIDCAPSVREVVEDLRASIPPSWWVHRPENFLFRPHATIAHHDNMKTSVNIREVEALIPKTAFHLPRIRVLQKAHDGQWYPCHF